MAKTAEKRSFFGMIGHGISSVGHGISGAGSSVVSSLKHLGNSDSLQVVNPEGGEQDTEEEAEQGRFKKEEREGLFKMMHKYIGADVTSMVTLPVVIFEPMTMLQKMAELMEYSELLNKADSTDDPNLRMVYSVAWAVSVYYAYQRTWKPFNPILGETYELMKEDGLRFVAEQVSHHPPMSAGHAENPHFVYDCTSKLKTKFLGNSLDVYPVGRTRVRLKKSGYELDLVPPPTKVHNLIFGRTWVDSPGDMILTNTTTGEKVVLYFQPCGWFGAGRYEVDGYVYNQSEEPQMLVTGKWNKSLSCQPCNADGDPIPGTKLEEVWHVAEQPKGDKFQYSKFAHHINSFESAPPGLLPSDSRLRPDRAALEHREMHKSAVEKSRLEERQRAEKQAREKNGHAFVPKWFELSGEAVQTPWEALEVYAFNNKYKVEREGGADSSTPEFNPWQFHEEEVELLQEPSVAQTGVLANK